MPKFKTDPMQALHMLGTHSSGKGTPSGLSVRSPRELSPLSHLTGGELDDRKTTYNLQVQIKRADSNKLYMKSFKEYIYLQAHASIH